MKRQFHLASSSVAICLIVHVILLTVDGKRLKCALVLNSDQHVGTLCKCYPVQVPPWSNTPVKPATSPQKGSVTFNSSNHFQPNIQWTQRGRHESGRYLYNASYYLEITFSTIYISSFSYNCDINSKKLNGKNNTSEITFSFKNCCESLMKGDLWKAGLELLVTIDATPMYNEDDTANSLEFEGVVPDRRELRPRKSRKVHQKKQTTITPTPALVTDAKFSEGGAISIHPQQTLHIVMAVFGTAFACVVFFVIILFFKKCSKQKKKFLGCQPRKILVIGDSNERFIPLHNEFTEILKKHGSAKTEVITNVRKMSDITKKGIVHWTTENLNQSDAVVLVLTEPEQIRSQNRKLESENETPRSHVTVAIAIAETLAPDIGFRVAKDKFIAFDVTNSIDRVKLPCCTIYNMEKGFKKLLKHVLGHHYNQNTTDITDDITILQKLVCRAEILPVEVHESPCDTPGMKLNNLSRSDDSEARVDGKCTQTPDPNDLDRPLLYHHSEGVRSTANDNQHYSIENNELK